MHVSQDPRSAELAAAVKAAQAGAAVLRRYAGGLEEKDVGEKEEHDLVTFVDHEAEDAIRQSLQEAFADDAVLGEEAGEANVAPRTGRVWVVDPLDGTTNFAHDIPPYAVSIALCEDGRPVVGVVFDVAHDELYAGVRGTGASVNGRRLAVSATTELGQSLLATGFPYRDYRYMEGYMRSFEAVARATRGVRRHGCASVDLAWVARGRFDAFFEAGLAPWDMAAGVLLVTEAGGRVDGLPAGADAIWDGAIVASNNLVHDALADLLDPLATAWESRDKRSES